MREFRVFIYADGLVLPLVVPLECTAQSLIDHLKAIFAQDLIATRADIWDGGTMIMRIDAGGIAALMERSRTKCTPPQHLETRH